MTKASIFGLIIACLISPVSFANEWRVNTDKYCPTYYTHDEDNNVDVNFCESWADIQFQWSTTGYSTQTYTTSGGTTVAQANYRNVMDIYCSKSGYAPGYAYLEAYVYMDPEGAWCYASANWA